MSGDPHKPDLLDLLDRWPELNRLAAIGMAVERFQRTVVITVVEKVQAGTPYDFADPMTGAFGQCVQADDGTWTQAPRGQAPVILHCRRKKA